MSYENGLEEAKRLATNYLEIQLRMAERLSSLSDSDVKKFNKWYKGHPLWTSLPERLFKLNKIRNKDKQ
jgi:hypothetical protein